MFSLKGRAKEDDITEGKGLPISLLEVEILKFFDQFLLTLLKKFLLVLHLDALYELDCFENVVRHGVIVSLPLHVDIVVVEGHIEGKGSHFGHVIELSKVFVDDFLE